MSFGAAQLLAGNLFAGHRLDDGGARDMHDADLVNHKDVVRQSGTVHRAAGRRTDDDRHLRDDAAGNGIAVKDSTVAVQSVNGFLNAGSAAVVDADDRTAVAKGKVHDFADLGGMHLSQRTAEDRKVLAENVNDAPADRAVAGNDAVA